MQTMSKTDRMETAPSRDWENLMLACFSCLYLSGLTLFLSFLVNTGVIQFVVSNDLSCFTLTQKKQVVGFSGQSSNCSFSSKISEQIHCYRNTLLVSLTLLHC